MSEQKPYEYIFAAHKTGIAGSPYRIIKAREASGNGHEVCAVQLTQGQWATIDVCDIESVTKHAWSLAKDEWNTYAKSTISRQNVLMHRMIAGASKSDKSIDQIYGNGLNNTSSNLRIAGPALNNYNARKSKKPMLSKYKGVSYDKVNKKWTVCIRRGKEFAFKRFATEEQAAEYYNDAMAIIASNVRINQI